MIARSRTASGVSGPAHRNVPAPAAVSPALSRLIAGAGNRALDHDDVSHEREKTNLSPDHTAEEAAKARAAKAKK